jgi:hypothetical protein
VSLRKNNKLVENNFEKNSLFNKESERLVKEKNQE